MRNEPDLLPPPVLMLLTASFEPGAVALIGPTQGGFSHYSALVTVEERRCVVKAANLPLQRADVRREARMLALLQGSGLPVPELVALFEDETWTVALLGALPGANALRLYTQAPGDLLRLAGELGVLLAHLHQPAATPADPDLLIADRMAPMQEQLPQLDMPPELRSLLNESLAPAHWHSAEPCIVHGDAGVHNILWDDTITGLLDWEWSGWGNPAQDLAWLAWTLRFRMAPPELWEELKRNYLQAGGCFPELEPAAVRALVFGQMAAIMLRAQTPDLQAEWIRRIRWTMEMKLRW
jgi:aminoglycoside phosphotransferase (APT) family kinase protein